MYEGWVFRSVNVRGLVREMWSEGVNMVWDIAVWVDECGLVRVCVVWDGVRLIVHLCTGIGVEA